MKKKVIIKKLTAADFPASVKPFWTNAKSAGDVLIRIKYVIIALICYCALSPRLRVKYYYNLMISMILLNLLIIGPTGKGKSVVRSIVYKILGLFFERDDKERDIENSFKRENKRKGNNQRKDEEPLWAYRILQKFTLPVAVKLADNIRRRYGDLLPFYLYADELGAFTENKRGSVEFSSVARTAYNIGEIYSRDTLYEGGYNARVDICWNSIMCGQDVALSKYINKEGLLMGDASRNIIFRLGEELGEEPPTILPFTAEQDIYISDTVNRLMRETFTDDDKLMPIHEVDMKWINKDVIAWCDQQREIISKSGSRAHDSFYGRASESAFRLATILYHLWGEDPKRQKNVRKCYYYFAQYILDGIMEQWGQQYEAAIPKDKETTIARPTLYDSLPKRFTRTQLCEKIKELGISSAARKFIYIWLQKKWIFEVEGEPDTYEKIY